MHNSDLDEVIPVSALNTGEKISMLTPGVKSPKHDNY